MLKVGVIGLGYWGPKLARNFHELPDAKLEWKSPWPPVWSKPRKSSQRVVLGMEPASVSARRGMYVQRKRGIHDVIYLTLDFPNGVLADIRVSWLDPCKIRRYTETRL